MYQAKVGDMRINKHPESYRGEEKEHLLCVYEWGGWQYHGTGNSAPEGELSTLQAKLGVPVGEDSEYIYYSPTN